MVGLRFGVRIEGMAGFAADAVLGDRVFQVLTEPRDARRLRASLMEIARVAATGSHRRAALLLDEPGISDARLRDEWQGAASVLRPELLDRIAIYIRRSGQWSGLPDAPDEHQRAALDEVVDCSLATRPARPGRGSDAQYEILCVLIHHWLLGKGPVAISALMAISGRSHPTVARALNHFAHNIKRHSDRSVELRFFPREEWTRMVALSDRFRRTIRFTDQSGQPRSAESLLRRLHGLQRNDIAVGGVWGALHYHPPLDLVGTPRLDLSVHAPKAPPDLSFVKRLDPALEQSTRRDDSPTLVVHVLRRSDPLFERDGNEGSWADPVECLLDLHEARLEPQALELLRSFPPAKDQHL